MSRLHLRSIFPGVVLMLALLALPARANILWNDSGPVLVQENGDGQDILHQTVKRDDSANDTLYFKFTVNPLSDVTREEYSAGFQLYYGDQERFGVGNSLKAWAYSAFNTADTGPDNAVPGDIDLHSASPESYQPGRYLSYELPRRDIKRTFVFRVQYVPNGLDVVTVWMNPNLSPGATEDNQMTNLTTRFKAYATFNEVRLRHHGNGDGWIFSDMAVATSFNDFIVPYFWQQWWFITVVIVTIVIWAAITVRVVEKRRFRLQLQRAEQQSALERERSRIAQDLHDDLGSSLTRLSLLSSLIKADKDNPEQVEAHAAKLAESADQTVRSLEEIVWAVRPGSDTVQSLMDYTAHFASELFEGNSIKCRLDLPRDLPDLPLPPDQRHNIFLIVKEALTNALKHSSATEVRVQARWSGSELEILVADNGKGFDPSSPAKLRRNGLGNLRRRAEAAGGTLDLKNTDGGGTTVRLVVKIKNGNGGGKA